MCRWLAYSGTPISLDELLYNPRYSLIEQSAHSRLGVETTNGDGLRSFSGYTTDPSATSPCWQPVPESSYGVIQKGEDEIGRFTPVRP
jgi:hypothetical protein